MLCEYGKIESWRLNTGRFSTGKLSTGRTIIVKLNSVRSNMDMYNYAIAEQ